MSKKYRILQCNFNFCTKAKVFYVIINWLIIIHEVALGGFREYEKIITDQLFAYTGISGM